MLNSLPPSLAALGALDWTLLAVLAASTLLGLWRGLMFELMSLAGWVVAYVAAQAFSPQVAPRLPIGAPGSALNQGAALAATFIAVLLGWALLARLVRLLVRATPLTVPDRLLGAVFGLLRGGVLLLALATLVAFTPLSRTATWQNSHGAALLSQGLRSLKPLLPAEVAQHLPD